MGGLHYAAMGGHSECFHCLLQHKADPSLRTQAGGNALDVARKYGNPRAISKAGKHDAWGTSFSCSLQVI